MRIVFWQNTPSMHQSAQIRALAECPGCEVVLVVQECAVPERRITMGWRAADFGTAQLVCKPSNLLIQELIDNGLRDTIHIFSGISSYPLVHRAFKYAVKAGARIGLLSESPDRRGWRGRVRQIRAKVEALRFNRLIEFILAIGGTGVQWFLNAGYPASKVFSYGYFVEQPASRLNKESSHDVRIVFVGRLSPEKGVDLLLRALSDLQEMRWSLHLVGDGPLRLHLQELADRLGLSQRITFVGNLPHAKAMEEVEVADVLVLPSRHDGWGAVVSEALMRGTPVICSDSCGAAALLGDASRGMVFPSGSISHLRDSLATATAAGVITLDRAQRIKRWSQAIDADSAASYLLEIINTQGNRVIRPLAPWDRPVE